jgi:hypothetical protein
VKLTGGRARKRRRRFSPGESVFAFFLRGDFVVMPPSASCADASASSSSSSSGGAGRFLRGVDLEDGLSGLDFVLVVLLALGLYGEALLCGVARLLSEYV